MNIVPPHPLIRFFHSAFLCLLALFLVSCASGSRPAWPPRPGEPTVAVTVYGERFHSRIGLPRAPQGTEEWSFGERVFFYEEKDTDHLKNKEYLIFFTDALRALCWPNAGVIEVSKADRPYNQRNPQARVSVWRIAVSEEGARRLRDYLQRSIGTPTALYHDDWQAYYTSAWRYDVLFTCHHYVAGALREAGVPVHPWWCFFPSGLWWQLDRLAQK